MNRSMKDYEQKYEMSERKYIVMDGSELLNKCPTMMNLATEGRKQVNTVLNVHRNHKTY